MILGDPKTEIIPAATLDDLFRRTAALRPDALDAAGCQEPSMKSARTASGNGASSARSSGPAGRPRAESSEPSK